jgi:hypothetical protein
MLRQSENRDGSDLCEGSRKIGTGAIYAKAVGKWGRERFMRRQSENGDGSDLCEGTLAFGEGRSALRAAGKSLPSLFSDPVRPPGGR